MTPADLAYFRYALDHRAIRGEVLEIGGRSWQNDGNLSRVAQDAGLHWQAADIEPGEGIDLCFDILDDRTVRSIGKRWDTVLLFNLLEHVYDPVAALQNSLSLLKRGGHCVIVTPTVWQLHDFPADYWRPMPDFYIRFAIENQLTLRLDLFVWIVASKLIPVESLNEGSQKQMPSKVVLRGARQRYSDLVHRLFNTSGRETFFPYSALGVAFQCRH